MNDKDKLKEGLDNFLEGRKALEEKCDTLPRCKKARGCNSCVIYSKIQELDRKIDEIEEMIENPQNEEEEYSVVDYSYYDDHKGETDGNGNIIDYSWYDDHKGEWL